MPLACAGHKVYAVAHVSLEEYHDGLALKGLGLCEGVKNSLHVVAVRYDGVPAEGFPNCRKVSVAPAAGGAGTGSSPLFQGCRAVIPRTRHAHAATAAMGFCQRRRPVLRVPASPGKGDACCGREALAK